MTELGLHIRLARLALIISATLAICCHSSLAVEVQKAKNDNPLRGHQKWTDNTGKYTFEASFIDYENEVVHLLSKESKLKKVPLKRLSNADQEYLKFIELYGLDLFDDLTGIDQQSRQNAANRLLGAKLPRKTLPAVKVYIEKEIEELAIPLNEGRKRKGKIDSIPFQGDETSLVRIKSDPQKYLGENTYLIGIVKSSSYYNYGYDNAERSHYSLSFHEFGANATSTRERAHLYVPRSFSELLIERVNRAEESGHSLLIRAKAQLNPNRYRGASSWDLLELEDWQLFDRNTSRWKAWSLKGFHLGLSVLASFQELDPILSILSSEEPYGNSIADLYVRILVGEALLKHDYKRKDADKLIKLICSVKFYASTESDARTRQFAIAAIGKLNPTDKRYAARKIKRELSLAKRQGNDHILKWATKASVAAEGNKNPNTFGGEFGGSLYGR